MLDTIQLLTEIIKSILSLFGLMLLPLKLPLLDRAPELLFRELRYVESWVVLNENLSEVEEVFQFSVHKFSWFLCCKFEGCDLSEELGLARVCLVDVDVLQLPHYLAVRLWFEKSRFCVQFDFGQPLLLVLRVPPFLRTRRSKLILRAWLHLSLGEQNGLRELNRLIFCVQEELGHMTLFVERVDEVVVSKAIKVHASRSISLCLSLNPSLFFLKLL